jgi:hypothetical protein
MGEPLGQPKASAKCRWLLTAPRTRSQAREWGSVRSWCATAWSVIFEHQSCANATKKSWLSESGTCTPVAAMVYEER